MLTMSNSNLGDSRNQKRRSVRVVSAAPTQSSDNGLKARSHAEAAMPILDALGLGTEKVTMDTAPEVVSLETETDSAKSFGLSSSDFLAISDENWPHAASSASEAVLLLPGVGREPAQVIAQESKRAVFAVDDTAMEFAGPGSWSTTLRALDALVIEESAAKLMTQGETISAAAQTLDNMSRSGLVVVVSKKYLCIRARGQELRFDWPFELEPASILPALAAGVSACLIEGKCAKEIGHVMLAIATANNLLDSEATTSVTELQNRGVQLAAETAIQKRMHELRRVRVGQLVGTSITAFVVLVSLLSVAWLNTLA